MEDYNSYKESFDKVDMFCSINSVGCKVVV